MANDIRRLLREATQEGWTVEIGSKHYRLTYPNGALVFVSFSASDHRAFMNIRADIRRALRNGRGR